MNSRGHILQWSVQDNHSGPMRWKAVPGGLRVNALSQILQMMMHMTVNDDQAGCKASTSLIRQW